MFEKKKKTVAHALSKLGHDPFFFQQSLFYKVGTSLVIKWYLYLYNKWM